MNCVTAWEQFLGDTTETAREEVSGWQTSEDGGQENLRVTPDNWQLAESAEFTVDPGSGCCRLQAKEKN